MATLETQKMLAAAVDAADSKKAEDIRILQLDAAESALTDYFLVCSGTNDRQNVAIADEIEFRMKRDFGTLPNAVEGRRQGEWILMDYVDFVAHIMLPEKRDYYGLERLKKSATRLTPAELNDDVNKRIADGRAKTAARKTTKPANKTAAKKTPVKKVAKKAAKTAVKKTSAKKSGTKKAANKAAKKR